VDEPWVCGCGETIDMAVMHPFDLGVPDSGVLSQPNDARTD
jgi:hypothetical protein